MRLVLFFVLLVVGCGPAPAPASAPSAILGHPLPTLSGRTISGDKLSKEALANKIVVVKFFAKYCKPCKKTLPAAQELHAAQPDVVFVGVAEDEYATDVQEMINTYGLTFPVIHDRNNIVAGRFRVDQLPATFVADVNGDIRWVGSSEQSESDLENAIAWARKPAATR